jgi:immune inhibitor A
MNTVKRIVITLIFLLLSPSHNPSSFANSFNALVILVNFQDAKSTILREQYHQLFNAENYSTPNAALSVRSYVKEVSRDAVDLQVTVTDWITLPHEVAYYEAKDGGEISEGPETMVRDAIELLKGQAFDFTPYDNDGDGRADLIGLVHRGSNPQYGTGRAPDWSTVPIFNPEITAGSVTINRAWMITDSNSAFGTMTTIGGLLHEMVGHTLCNVPDLNDWLPGSWGQMYGGNAFNPTQYSAYTKQGCGWVKVIDIESTGSVAISPVEESGKVYRLWIDPYRDSEYFLLEYRKRTGVDQSLPASGLLIWHVDHFADQSNFLRLEQADGRDDLAQTFGFGAADATDPFTGVSGNNSFTPETTPSSASRSGQNTGIRVDGITKSMLSDEIMTEITPANTLSGITLKYDESYPLFAWNWFPPGGNKQGERVAVRFASPSSGSLKKVKLNLRGPPPSVDSPMGYDLKVYHEFLTGNILPEQPRHELQGQITSEGENEWYTIELDTPLAIVAGETFIIDIAWSDPMVSIDYIGRTSGNSFYRAPGESAYISIPYDVRLRALIDTTDHTAQPQPVYQNNILTIPRVAIDQLLFDYTAITMKMSDDGRWDVLGFTPDQYAIAETAVQFGSGVLAIPRVAVNLSEGVTLNYVDVRFIAGPDGRFDLVSGRPE